MQQQNTVESTGSPIPNPTTVDAGPGSTVPEEHLSHGRDSSNMSGHAIPAMLCGNQYAVLFDAEPTELEDLDGF